VAARTRSTDDRQRVPWLGALLETARKDFQPRDFAERHLVDEMAFNKWRLLRVYGMEKAALEVGCDHYLSKPFDLWELDRVLKSLGFIL